MNAVRAAGEDLGAAWDAYVDAHPQGTIFHLQGWLRSVERSFGHKDVSLYAERDGSIVGVLPLFAVPTLKGRALVSVPYAVYGGPLGEGPDDVQLLVDAARQLAEEHNAKYIELRSREQTGLELPENDLYVTFERALPATPEECLGLIPRKSRASVRNGRSKFGVRSEWTQELGTLYELYALNVRRLGSPIFPFSFLEELRQAFEGCIDVQNVLFEDRIVASALSFYYKRTVIPYYSGTDDNYFFTQCSNVMYCDLMEEGVRRGYTHFDFGRSRREAGPYRFKINMGFEPRPLHYQYVLLGLQELPKINPSNPRFELPRKIWSHLPLGVTKVVGPQLLKYIP